MSVHMTEDGSVSDAEIAYTERRAMGGVSMIIVGSLCIWPDGNFGGQIFIHDDGCIPGLRRLTEAVHRHDCLIAAQLHHAGRETNARTSGFQPVAPSYFEPETHSVFKAEYDAPGCWKPARSNSTSNITRRPCAAPRKRALMPASCTARMGI